MRSAAVALLALVSLALVGCAGQAPAPYGFPGPDWHNYSLASWYIHTRPVAICIRAHESDTGDYNHDGLHDDGYQAVNPKSGAAGAYQFLQSTWDGVNQRLGRPQLVGVRPNTVGIVFQDEAFWLLLHERGTQPWTGSGC